MSVVVKLSDGTRIALDRNLYVSGVAAQVNEGRGKGKLLEFPNDQTPSRGVFIDPDDVVFVYSDR